MQGNMVSVTEAQAHLNSARQQRNSALDALVSVEAALTMAQSRIQQLEADLAALSPKAEVEIAEDVKGSEDSHPDNQPSTD